MKCNYCGNKIMKKSLWLYLRFLFKDRVYLTCPCCGRVSSYLVQVNIIHDTLDQKEKHYNKLITLERERGDKS